MTLDFDARVTGQERLGPKLGAVQRAIAQELAAALYQECEATMAVSKAQYAPVETGALRSSGFVEPPKVSGTTVVVRLGYGGAAKEYALIVHERLGVNHPVGQAKYLETPVLERLPGMATRIRARVAGAVGRSAR